ncbi:MAG: hypothetical protein MK171_13190 [Pirellulales bacterium]|nr:hypothetical protein [Pirellulales bacterium]
MNHAPALPSPSRGTRSRPWQLAGPLLTWALVAMVIVQLAVGLLVVCRRLTGALTNDLSPAQMLLAALIATATVTCTRIAWRPLLGRNPWHDPLIGWGSSLALALFAIGCAFPAYQTSDWMIWLPLVMADQLWRKNFFDVGQRAAEAAGGTSKRSVLPGAAAQLHPVASSRTGKILSAECEQAHDEDVVQQLYRVRNRQGHEMIYGALRADFSAGQRTAVVHAAFCPPLPYFPEIEADAISGHATRIKVVQALAHGVRLDVRLAAVAEQACYVWIDMAARPTSPKPKILSA